MLNIQKLSTSSTMYKLYTTKSISLLLYLQLRNSKWRIIYWKWFSRIFSLGCINYGRDLVRFLDIKLEWWRTIMIKELKILLYKLIPSIHDLPQVIYIRWLDRDWYIKKWLDRILFGFIIIWFCWCKVRCLEK